MADGLRPKARLTVAMLAGLGGLVASGFVGQPGITAEAVWQQSARIRETRQAVPRDRAPARDTRPDGRTEAATDSPKTGMPRQQARRAGVLSQLLERRGLADDRRAPLRARTSS
jgi:hypothetical protein